MNRGQCNGYQRRYVELEALGVWMYAAVVVVVVVDAVAVEAVVADVVLVAAVN